MLLLRHFPPRPSRIRPGCPASKRAQHSRHNAPSHARRRCHRPIHLHHRQPRPHIDYSHSRARA
ncbi:hypothetical protein C8R44DRAFT_987452 [Mycena epipterygia]|nr:hypothetical protein C8R44DRAFT_987452 [Mycena epipterygia]